MVGEKGQAGGAVMGRPVGRTAAGTARGEVQRGA